MKNIKNYFTFLAVFAMIFTSCSKDESGVDATTEKATLSFGAIVADLANSTNKQSSVSDLPQCSDAAPSYVEIVLMQGDEYIIGADAPYRVDLAAGQVSLKKMLLWNLNLDNILLSISLCMMPPGILPGSHLKAEFLKNL
ncbi:MAG: hypothetical protein R3209_11340 [Salinimicrobium sediminis]|nr:hypothetical protein [Salinimicrobium sediminis]